MVVGIFKSLRMTDRSSAWDTSCLHLTGDFVEVTDRLPMHGFFPRFAHTSMSTPSNS